MGPSTTPLRGQPSPSSTTPGWTSHQSPSLKWTTRSPNLPKNRAAGIDDIPTEAWQWLDSNNRTYLLNLRNDAWTSQVIPQEWQTALVVETYKTKGALADPNNYRPISFLSTAYKLLARIWQQRLSGPRPKRSQHTVRFQDGSFHLTASPCHPQTS